jgi:hypothetical protein
LLPIVAVKLPANCVQIDRAHCNENAADDRYPAPIAFRSNNKKSIPAQAAVSAEDRFLALPARFLGRPRRVLDAGPVRTSCEMRGPAFESLPRRKPRRAWGRDETRAMGI